MQAMVFGNMGNDCATGVAFTRDPSTGSNEFYGEFLVNAQGEDVVAGIRTPQELTIKARKSHGSDLPSLEEVMPNIFKQLLSVRSQLETHYKDRKAKEPQTLETEARFFQKSPVDSRTCKISSSRFNKASSTCCRLATASARPRLRCRLPLTWPGRASSRSLRRL